MLKDICIQSNLDTLTKLWSKSNFGKLASTSKKKRSKFSFYMDLWRKPWVGVSQFFLILFFLTCGQIPVLKYQQRYRVQNITTPYPKNVNFCIVYESSFKDTVDYLFQDKHWKCSAVEITEWSTHLVFLHPCEMSTGSEQLLLWPNYQIRKVPCEWCNDRLQKEFDLRRLTYLVYNKTSVLYFS